MKTTNKITGLGKIALFVLFTLFISTAVKAESRKFSPNVYMMNLDALMNTQNAMLKYKAPETTETDVTNEMNTLDFLVDAADNMLKYKAPVIDEDIEVGIELRELELTFTTLDKVIKYSAPQYAGLDDEINEATDTMFAETK